MNDDISTKQINAIFPLENAHIALTDTLSSHETEAISISLDCSNQVFSLFNALATATSNIILHSNDDCYFENFLNHLCHISTIDEFLNQAKKQLIIKVKKKNIIRHFIQYAGKTNICLEAVISKYLGFVLNTSFFNRVRQNPNFKSKLIP